MNRFRQEHSNPDHGSTQTALSTRHHNDTSQARNPWWFPTNGLARPPVVPIAHATAGTSDFTEHFQRRSSAAHQEAERRVEAANRQFQEEALNRGFGLRRPAPIRSEEIKAKTYQLGYRFALILAAILGFSNASQAVDLTGAGLVWPIKLVIIAAAVLFTLLAFKAIAKTYLTAAVNLDSFQNRGQPEINRWFKRLGLLFALIAIPSVFLRMDTGFPEAVGVVFWIAWEFITVMIAALAALALGYYAWSGELAQQYEEALASLNQT